MDKQKNEKGLISPNKIVLPVSEKENGVLDDFILTNDKTCLENFTCCICSCLAWDPVCCPKCDKPFCRACIVKYGKTKICPFKCEINSFREITRNEKNYLNKIKIKCTNIGCSKYIQYSDYKDHLEKCSFRKYHCVNYPCKEEGYINNMISHVKNCPHRIVECSKCKQNIKFCEMKVHQQEFCPEIIVKCKFCKCPMKRGVYLKEHLSENNENAKCLKVQIERWAKMYNDDINIKNSEINELKNKIKEMEKKQKMIESENNKLKKNSEDIKTFFKKTYNRFFTEENEKVMEDNTSNKKELGNRILKQCSSIDRIRFNKKKVSNCIYNKFDLNKKNETNQPEKQLFKMNFQNKKDYFQGEIPTKLLKQRRKMSNLDNSLIKSPKLYNVCTYDSNNS